MEAGQRVHIFFDSTELIRKDSREFGGISSPELSELVAEIGAQLYIADLVVDEFVSVRFREFQHDYKMAESKVKPYVGLGEAPEEQRLREAFKSEAETAVAKTPATIFKASFLSEDLAALSKEESLRVNKKKDLGFSDALIFLGCLQHAVTHGLQDCWFISSDNGFDEDALKAVAERHGITFRLAKNTNSIVQLLKELRVAQLPSFETEVAKRTLGFTQAQTQTILAYLNAHALPYEHIVPFILRKPLEAESAGLQVFTFGPGDSITVSAKSVRIDAALPEGRTGEGSYCSIVFHGRVDVEVLVDRRGGQAMPRPSPYYGSFIYRQFGMYHASGRSVERVEVPVRGKARALLKAGALVPPLEIDSISVTADEGAAE